MSTIERTESSRESQRESAENKQDSPIKHLLLDGVQFEVQKFLGEGAFGGVYRAVYGGVACAIKQQSFEQDFYVYTVQDFQRECLLHSKLVLGDISILYRIV